MRTHVGILAVIIVLGGLAAIGLAQVGFGPTVDYFMLGLSGNAQRDVQYDGTVPTQPKTNIGVSTTNYVRLFGAPTASGPTIQMIGSDSNIDLQLIPKGTGVVNAVIPWTSFKKFFAATTFCADYTTATAAVNTRIAANDAALARTATAAETHNFICNLPFSGERTTASKGVKIDTMSLIYQVTTAALTTHTITNAAIVNYVNAVANLIDTGKVTITGTLSTATQTNPYVTALTVTAPPYLTQAQTALNLEFQAVMANTGVYRLYGIYVGYTWAL